jgi:hypothetical protein
MDDPPDSWLLSSSSRAIRQYYDSPMTTNLDCVARSVKRRLSAEQRAVVYYAHTKTRMEKLSHFELHDDARSTREVTDKPVHFSVVAKF